MECGGYAATVPGAPTNLIATADGQTTINLRWTAPSSDGGSPITGYLVQVSADGSSDSWSPLVASQTQTTYSHTGLTAGTTQHYRVFAINAQGNSIASNTANATTVASTDPEPSSPMRPNAPTALTITPSGRTILQLTWTAPTSDGGSTVTGYIVDISLDGSTYNELARTIKPRYTHRGLNAGDVRHYQIRAVNIVGAGTPSDPARSATSSETSVPSDPTDLMVIPSGRTLVELSWTAPADDGGAAITGYQIDVGQASESTAQMQQQESIFKRAQDPVLMWMTLIDNTGSNETRYVHRELAPNTTRHYRVLAINSIGTSLVTDPLSATTVDSSTPTIPSDPLELTATLDDPSTATLAWSAPANDGGSSLIGYRIEVSIDAGTFTELMASQTETTYIHTGLAPKTAYVYRVVAINAQGSSLPSNTAQIGDVLPTLSFAMTASTASESSGEVTIAVTPTADVPLQVRLSGTATPELDYTVTGRSSSRLVVTLIDDETPESDETVVLTLTESDLYRVAAPQTYTLTITDDDEAILGFVASIADQTWFQSLPMDTLTLPPAIYGRTPHIYTLTPALPAGLTFDASTRQITGTPTDITPATTYTYTVTDADEIKATLTLTVEVTPPPALMFADTIKHHVYVLDQPIGEVLLPKAQGGVPPYRYSLAPDLPAGLTFDATTRTLSGTPTTLTPSRTLTYTVVDAMQTQVQRSFTLEVYTISFETQIADPSYTVGTPISELVLPEVNGAKPPVTYTLTLLDLPLGLQFDLDRRAISGTPLEGAPPTELTWKAVNVYGARDSLIFTVEVLTAQTTNGRDGLPEAFAVHSNYPNPFQQATTLVLNLPWPAQVQVEVLDLAGRRMHVTAAKEMNAGWDQTMELGNLTLSSGVYLYRLRVRSDEATAQDHVGRFMRVR